MGKAILFRASIIAMISILVSVSVTYLIMHFFHGKIEPLAIITAFIMPAIIAFPASIWMGKQSRKLEIANQQLIENCHELEQLRRKAELQAQTDSMTGLYNRNHFFQTVRDELKQPGDGALIVLDADHFKSINDQFGHSAGDSALIEIVHALKSNIRPEDHIGRIGGEEFAIFLPQTSESTARNLANTLANSVFEIEFMPTPESKAQLSVSIGGVMRSHSDSFEMLMRNADARMYHAKKLGRNRVVFDGKNEFESRTKISANAA